MKHQRYHLPSRVLAIVLWLGMVSLGFGQQDQEQKRTLSLSAKSASNTGPVLHLLPLEEEQEIGNAVPVLLRITYEQDQFLREYRPKFYDYAELNIDDPRIQEFPYNGFAKQIMRAGGMSFADWQYPLRSNRPYAILLPDIQAQTDFVGRGMTIWIKQQLSKGQTDLAIQGIRGQLACSRHIAATPVVICHLVSTSIANRALDNLELVLQQPDAPNMYWTLATLPPTLGDVGRAVQWELWASPARLQEPLPPVGDKEWEKIAQHFIDLYSEVTEYTYTAQEAERVKSNIDRLSKSTLAEELQFTDEQIRKMSLEEKFMRWTYLQYCKLRAGMEPLAYQSLDQVIEAKKKAEQFEAQVLKTTEAKGSPFPIALPQAILACHNFGRRVKFLQTVESLRDYASKHKGAFPKSLAELELPAPNDPFTQEPFLYESDGKTAKLRQAENPDVTLKPYDYVLVVK